MTLTYIVAATFLGGLISVLLAAALSAPLLGLIVRHLVSLSTGVLLGTALLHVLPEAFGSGEPPQALFLTLLGGLLFSSCWRKPSCTGMATTMNTTTTITITVLTPNRPGAAAGACWWVTASTTSVTVS